MPPRIVGASLGKDRTSVQVTYAGNDPIDMTNHDFDSPSEARHFINDVNRSVRAGGRLIMARDIEFYGGPADGKTCQAVITKLPLTCTICDLDSEPPRFHDYEANSIPESGAIRLCLCAQQQA